VSRSELSGIRALWDAIPDPDEKTQQRVRHRLTAAAAPPPSLTAEKPAKLLRRPLSRRVLIAAAALLVAAGATAFSFGVHVPVIDFWSSSKVNHGSRIYRDFKLLDVGAPPGMATGVLPGETRKVATIDGATLWVAPTKDGGFCTLFGHTGGCDRTGTVPLSLTFTAANVPPGRSPLTTPPEEIASIVSGYVNGRWADALELRFTDGKRVRPPLVWVSKPIDAGFFYYRTSPEEREPGHALAAAVALTDDGTVITAERFPPTAESSPPEDAITDRARALLKIESRDETAVLRRAPTRYDGRCGWLDFAGRHFDVGPCLPENYARDGFEWRFVHSSDDVLLVGAVPPTYRSIVIGYADGSKTEIRPTRDGLDSWFVFEIPADHLRRSNEVTVVSAIDGEGRRLETKPLPQALLQQPCEGPLPIPDPSDCP
jgi:hypothetical protein